MLHDRRITPLVLKFAALTCAALGLTVPSLESWAQDRFEAPVGPQTWSPTERAEFGAFDGNYVGFLSSYDGRVRRDTTDDDARRRAFRAAGIDPGILIFPDALVDTSMVIPAPDLVDPHMVLPPLGRRSHPRDVPEAPDDEPPGDEPPAD